ncbi:MAG: LysM peptidoglycan-binding domain-containing protein [Defluviitaleaceae bacterium]|nr:LysM peptidoglycan-binding domain-containing protein [Defluviitaleaceae bacterium]
MNDKEKFEEKFGSVEEFSRSAVGSLFDDKMAADIKPMVESSIDEDELAKQELLKGLFGDGPSSDMPKKPPYQRMGKNTDPEAEHQAYLDLASEQNRKAQLKEQAEKEASIKHREEQLKDLPKSPRPVKREKEETAPQRTAKPQQAQPAYRLDMRKVAAIGLFFVLVIFGVLVWQIVATNNELANANEQIEALYADVEELAELRHQNMELANNIEQLQAQLDAMGTTDLPNETDSDNDDILPPTLDTTTTAPTQTGQTTSPNIPNTTIDAAGRLIYTIQPGDNLSIISRLFFGDTTRVADIRAANGMTNDTVITGNTLIIPRN